MAPTPDFILSASSREEDIAQAYQLRCNSYVLKPMGFESFQRSVKAIVPRRGCK